MPIAVQINASVVRQEIPTQNQALVHKLQVFVVCPDVAVLLFLERGAVGLRTFSAQLNFLFVVRLGIERRVDINQVHLAPEVFEKVAHHLQVVSPVDFVSPAVHIVAVAFLQLRRVIGRAGKGAFARPAQLRVTANRLVVEFKKFFFVSHVFLVKRFFPQ